MASALPPFAAAAEDKVAAGFEGPEKRIEINFDFSAIDHSASLAQPPSSPLSSSSSSLGLRCLPSSLWHSVVSLLNGRFVIPPLPLFVSHF
jgi:hypothetical protein